MSSENLQSVENPYANLTGEDIERIYAQIAREKEMLDWQYYYINMEIQDRANRINKGEQIDQTMIPPFLQQKAAQVYEAQKSLNNPVKITNNEGKTIISDKNFDFSNFSIIAKSDPPQQKVVDKILKKYLKH